jgi:DNA (cytosine-5)-methyltransferase 1
VTALYNEIESYPVQWLSNLINANAIAPGIVSHCDIRALTPQNVASFNQLHVFAGIGIWSYALRLAGWPDELAVWTGSCPCQPFSIAGRRKGFDDDRHLWPVWFRLIRECRPAVLFGEQTASADGLKWFDVVSADLEGAGYAVGACDIPAAGVGAPHQRQRLYFVAYALDQRHAWLDALLRTTAGRRQPGDLLEVARGSAPGGFPVADITLRRHAEGRASAARASGQDRTRLADGSLPCADSLGHTRSTGSGRHTSAVSSAQGESASQRSAARGVVDLAIPAGATGGFWADAEWLPGVDGKWRCAQPGTFPLVDGTTYGLDGDSPSRGKVLYSSGNALVAPQAAVFIRAFLDTCFDALAEMA